MAELSIIVPVFNERLTIKTVLNRVLEATVQEGMTKQIIVVDDGSSDGSRDEIFSFINDHPAVKIKLVDHAINQGKGASIQSALLHSTGDYILIQDADLEYDPSEYTRLLQPILDGHADVVYGSRFMGHYPHRAMFFWHQIGNHFITFLSNLFNNLNLTDVETGYKVFSAVILKRIALRQRRFGFEPEVTAKVSKIRGVRIYEVGISYYGRSYDEGKKIGWQDGIKALYCIVRYGM